MKDLECQAEGLSLSCIQEPERVSKLGSDKIRCDLAKRRKGAQPAP